MKNQTHNGKDLIVIIRSYRVRIGSAPVLKCHLTTLNNICYKRITERILEKLNMKTVYAKGTTEHTVQLFETWSHQNPTLAMMIYIVAGLALFYVTAKVYDWAVN